MVQNVQINLLIFHTQYQISSDLKILGKFSKLFHILKLLIVWLVSLSWMRPEIRASLETWTFFGHPLLVGYPDCQYNQSTTPNFEKKNYPDSIIFELRYFQLYKVVFFNSLISDYNKTFLSLRRLNNTTKVVNSTTKLSLTNKYKIRRA